MSENRVLFSRAFVFSLFIFLILNIVFIIQRKLYLRGLNTNTISIINIAEKYINGDFRDAVNGSFAPLCSLVLIPFMVLGVRPIFSVYIVNIILGLLLLVGARLLSRRFELTERSKNMVSFTLIPVVLQFTLRDHIADLSVACILAYYLYLTFDNDYADRASSGFLSGLICAAGYLFKSYVLPFFISHFMLVNLSNYLKHKDKRKLVLRNAILGIAVFSLVSGLWIAALSYKYNKVTFSTSGEYNHRQIGPGVPDPPGEIWGTFEGWRKNIRKGQPVYDQGFFPPPNKTALSVWEDFSLLTPYLKPWSPFESKENFKYYLKHIVKNIYYTIGIFETSFSILSSAIIIGYILSYVPRLNFKGLMDLKLLPVTTIVLYSGGYIILHPDERYSWILNILILLMGAHLLDLLFQNSFFTKARRNILITFIVFSFIFVPVKNISTASVAEELWELGQTLKERVNIKDSKIASSDKFSETLKMLFYSDVKFKYYGQAKKGISDAELLSELQKYDIDYYIVWVQPGINDIPGFLSQHKEAANIKPVKGNDLAPGLRIYSLKGKS